jgi:hypothetical protein
VAVLKTITTASRRLAEAELVLWLVLAGSVWLALFLRTELREARLLVGRVDMQLLKAVSLWRLEVREVI